MLSYGGLLKQKHKILNLDDAEDGNYNQNVISSYNKAIKNKQVN